jgi:hypothetical protein
LRGRAKFSIVSVMHSPQQAALSSLRASILLAGLLLRGRAR